MPSSARPFSVPGAADRWLTALACCLAGLITLATVFMVWRGADPLPFADQWFELVSPHPVTWHWLSRQHMEHRILLPRLVFVLDRWLTSETNQLNYAVNVLLQTATAGMLAWLARGAGQWGRTATAWGFATSLGLLFWAGQYQNFLWGFQVQFFGVLTAAAASFTLLARGGGGPAALAGVVLLEACAAYTLASGVLVALLTPSLALLLRRRPFYIAALGLAAVLILASYLAGYHTPNGSLDPRTALADPGGLLAYALLVLGMPLASPLLFHVPLMLGIPCACATGATGLYLLARPVWLTLRARGAVEPNRAALVGLAVFVLGMVGVTAAGRISKGLESALVSRYATPALVFWACVLLLLAVQSSARGQVPRRIKLVLLLPLLLLGASEWSSIRTGLDWVALRRAATPAVLAGVADTPVLERIYAVEPGKSFAESPLRQVWPALRAARTTVFAQAWASWLGTPLADHVTFMPRAACAGRMDSAIAVNEPLAPGFRAHGTAVLTATGGAADRLLLVDAAGIIRGYALGGLDLRALGLGTPAVAVPGTEWLGAYQGNAAVTAFVLTDGGVCALGP